MLRRLAITLSILAAIVPALCHATESEHIGMHVLPAPGQVVVDGKFDDWDLSSGILACGDMEHMRDTHSVWFHAMYDAQNLYFLARFQDETPLNNPGQIGADYGFQGDCLQVRFITAPGTPQERGGHFTCWRGRDGRDEIVYERGTTFKEGAVRNVKDEGVQQAFTRWPDGKGYTQEIAIPWSQLTRDGKPLKAGAKMQLAVEPNFTVGAHGRLSIKDIFKPNMTLDRVFTFMSHAQWGDATLEPKGRLTPRPVRLSDGREFPVKLEGGVPVVDWTGLIKAKELPGFKPITFQMPVDGYLSLNIKDSQGTVVRQLLSAAFMTKGKHTVQWDGLATPSWTRPSDPVAAGDYTWSAIYHTGIGLRLRGWACNGGSAPWDGASGKTNWGGDHGVPKYAAADDKQVYLAWSAAEAGKSVLALDLEGNVLWNNIRGGIGGASAIAAEGGVVYVLGGNAGLMADGGGVYKLTARDGSYIYWNDKEAVDLVVKDLWDNADDKPNRATGIAVQEGKLYLSFTDANTILTLDAKTGKRTGQLNVPSPGYLCVGGDGRLYVVSHGDSIKAVNTATGEATTVVAGLTDATGIALDAKGNLLVGVRGETNQVKVFTPDGKPVGAVGRAGGRARLGKWTPDGMAFIAGIAVDAQGKLWVAEADGTPKRVSVWNMNSGKLHKEFFGATGYGALGGAINPADSDLMVGQGCEWRLDQATGRATCLGVITRDGMEVSRFATGPSGRVYLAVAPGWIHGSNKIRIFERVADADFRLRTVFSYEGKDKTATTRLWSDENGDGQEQPDEVTTVDGHVTFSRWAMMLTPDLTIYSDDSQFKVTGFTSCGAPKYDLSHPTRMPAKGLGSADGSLVLQSGAYGVDHGLFECYDIASGKLRWTYPDNFVGVHGSHRAPPAEPGLIRGSYPPCGVAKLPAPIGNVWVIPTNVGEWHILTGEGYYLTRLFQPDPLKIRFPDEAIPGAVMDNAPPGMGGEDFGGSIAMGADGHLYVQAGKTGYWNMEVTGLDTVRAMPGGKVAINEADYKLAQAQHDEQLQAVVGTRRAVVAHMTPTFNGRIHDDFKGTDVLIFKKQDDAEVRAAAAWDDKNLYLAWEVRDRTPWINGAESPEMMYLGGDTVDFQLGVGAKADAKRDKAAMGDLRLSIGNFKGKPTAVLYRPVAADKHPKSFSSGVIKDYRIDSVQVLDEAVIHVRPSGDRYVVECAVPLQVIGLAPDQIDAAGATLRGDFGATHGDPAGKRTRLRTWWSNQHTGIVDDAVFELMIEPQYWGELTFKR